MAVTANTIETYDTTTMREDLHEGYKSISPTDFPFQNAIGTGTASNTMFEYSVLDLAAASSTNRVAEGEAAPGADAPTMAVKQANYCQISDKVAITSGTSERINSSTGEQRLKEQVAIKMKELKRDMETMILDNVAANAGSSGTARATAGLPAHLRTNVSRGATGGSGTTSGTGSAGYVNAAATDGTDRALAEADLQTVVAQCWDNGAEPSMVMVGSAAKQKISTFTGNSTRYKEAEDSKLNAAIHIYESDFGQLTIVPNRFQRSRDVFVLDPEYIKLNFLQTMKQKSLAETGHNQSKLIWAEYGLEVCNEAAHGIIADVDATL